VIEGKNMPEQNISTGLDENPASSLAFDAFISYRRSDGTNAARRLRQMLQRYDIRKRLRHLRRKKLSVFLDTIYERGSNDFYEHNIRPALLSSRYLIVLATPDAVLRPDGNDWLQREIQEFRTHRGADNILVVRAAGDFLAQLPGDLDVVAPNSQIIDLRNDGFWSLISPLRFSRLADEWIKLVAPLFDVPPEDMPRLRREQEIAQQRVLALAIGGLAGAMAFAVALSWYALTQQRASQQTLDNSLFAATQVIKTAGGLKLSREHEGEKRAMLMTACDLFDNMADQAAREKFGLERHHCDVDRISAQIDLGELDRARTNLRGIERRVRARYTEKGTAAWAHAISDILDLSIRIGLLSANGEAEESRVVLDNTRDYARLFNAHPSLSLAIGYSNRVWPLITGLERAGDFKGSAEVIETAAALFETMAREKRDPETESDEAAEERQNYGFSQASTLRRRLGWLQTEKLKDNESALATIAAAMALMQTGLSQTKNLEQYIVLRKEEMLAEEVRGTALLSTMRFVEGLEADRRALAIADELLGLKISDAQRKEFKKGKTFLNQRIAHVTTIAAAKKP
jgi:hypothetical protein